MVEDMELSEADICVQVSGDDVRALRAKNGCSLFEAHDELQFEILMKTIEAIDDPKTRVVLRWFAERVRK